MVHQDQLISTLQQQMQHIYAVLPTPIVPPVQVVPPAQHIHADVLPAPIVPPVQVAPHIPALPIQANQRARPGPAQHNDAQQCKLIVYVCTMNK